MSVDGNQVEGGAHTGVTKKADGSLDFSRAAHIVTPKEQKINERKNRLKLVVDEAAGLGVNESRLRGMVQTLSIHDRPMDTRLIVAKYGRETDLPPAEILRLTRSYAKEKVRATEDGDLYHYHQTSFDAFLSAAEHGGLISYDMLKELGKTRISSGSRPDVVQMTRDKYDSSGKLHERGITGQSMGAHSVDVTLVFDETVMDLPQYDCISQYPNSPTIPFDHLSAALVNTETDKAKAREIIERHHLNATVATREEWIKSKYEKKSAGEK